MKFENMQHNTMFAQGHIHMQYKCKNTQGSDKQHIQERSDPEGEREGNVKGGSNVLEMVYFLS